jgi:hypothetical protein
MGENFRNLLDQQNTIIAKKANKPVPAISPAAYAMCDMIGHAFYRYEQHVIDCQHLAQKAYAKANDLASEVQDLKSRVAVLEGRR